MKGVLPKLVCSVVKLRKQFDDGTQPGIAWFMQSHEKSQPHTATGYSCFAIPLAGKDSAPN